MRRFLFVSWLLGVSWHLASLLVLPDRVALHFDANGTPNGWGEPQTHVVLMVVLQTFMVFLVVGIPWIVRKTPTELVNLPNRDYWLADERLDETVSLLREHCDLLGIILQGFFLALGVCVTAANLADPVRLNNLVFLPILAVFLISILGWIVRLYVSFRVGDDVSGTRSK